MWSRPRGGFTLLEVLLVVMIVAILSALVIPSSQPNACERLEAMAGIVATDLAYGRSLAVSNNGKYRFTLDVPNNRYILQYTGTNPALATLPVTPFSSPGDPPTQHIVDFDDLPQLGPRVNLLIATSGAVPQAVGTLEFGPLGGTTSVTPTVIWLSTGSGVSISYITVQVDPVTGLATIGPYTTIGPPQSLFPTGGH